MGVFDKLKNIFFEEEYVEVEEPVKKVKPTIAKKIDLPEMPRIKDEKTSREKEIEEEVVEKVEKKGVSERDLKKNDSFKFPMSFQEEDFQEDSFIDETSTKKEKIETEYQHYNEKPKYSFEYKKEEPIKSSNYTSQPLYEGGEYKKEQKVFRPTPIISPIYGVLDKNYKKEEIVQKKEVRLSGSASSRKVDLDSIREKAYGDLASDITASMMENEETPENNNLLNEASLYDLNDDESPVVTKVTVGDAEEYYNDLGLEYNIDYKDNTNEKATGRRSNKNTDDTSNDNSEEESNLFDLIDSMYSDSEKEQ